MCRWLLRYLHLLCVFEIGKDNHRRHFQPDHLRVALWHLRDQSGRDDRSLSSSQVPRGSLDTRAGPRQTFGWSLCPFRVSASSFELRCVTHPYLQLTVTFCWRPLWPKWGRQAGYPTSRFTLKETEVKPPGSSWRACISPPAQVWVLTAYSVLRAKSAHSHPLTAPVCPAGEGGWQEQMLCFFSWSQSSV